MRSIHFEPDGWEDFLCWLGADWKMATRITRLTGEIQRDPFSGIGKPEPLKGDLSGYRSPLRSGPGPGEPAPPIFLRDRLAYGRPDLLAPAGEGGDVGRATRGREEHETRGVVLEHGAGQFPGPLAGVMIRDRGGRFLRCYLREACYPGACPMYRTRHIARTIRALRKFRWIPVPRMFRAARMFRVNRSRPSGWPGRRGP